MKRTLYFSIILIIAMLIVVGCKKGMKESGFSEEVIVEEEFLEGQFLEPPILTLKIDEKMYSTIMGGYSWAIEKNDGSMQAIITDTEGLPKLAKHEIEISVEKLETIELVFKDEPIKVSAKRWLVSVAELNSEDFKIENIKTEPVPVEGYLIKVQGDSEHAVYEINADFEQGQVTYAFVVKLEGIALKRDDFYESMVIGYWYQDDYGIYTGEYNTIDKQEIANVLLMLESSSIYEIENEIEFDENMSWLNLKSQEDDLFIGVTKSGVAKVDNEYFIKLSDELLAYLDKHNVYEVERHFD